MATSDREREAVLKMNDWLRQRHRLADTDLFQKLRRCCICLQSSCDYPSTCREQFETWARYKWTRALEDEWRRRNPELEPPNFRDGN